MVVTKGKCYICAAKTEFNINDSATLLREARCASCGASLRNSDLSRYIVKSLLHKDLSLKECLNDLRQFKILEAASCGPINNIIKNLPFYTCFEYFDGKKPGEYVNGILCNDLENLTFNSESFDLVITQDVLEHVKSPERALSEIQRVLKKGGFHIFSIPLHEYKRTHSRRLLRTVFHSDPLREGIQVETDWGFDICEIIDKHGMKTERYNEHIFYRPEEITNVDAEYENYMNTDHVNFFRYNSIVFISRKLQEGDSVEFTGERFIPEKSDSLEIKTEHLQRYYSLDGIVNGKVVLDAACGEGYGTMYLANRASKVIGIDISEETINMAKSKYKRDNLNYYCASINKIPIEDRSVDVVISFETIEHVDGQTQYDFMGEIKRVLKDDGLLIISTPDKEIYSDMFNYKNPFHVKEFRRSEFHFFLKSYFENIKMYRQRFEVVSLLNSGGEKNIKVVDTDGKASHNGKYLIAVCSNSEITISLDSIVFETDNKYIKLIQRIIDTQNEIEKLSVWGKRLDEEATKRNEIITSQNARIEELSAWGISQDEEIKKKGEIIISQNARIEELSGWGTSQDEEIKKRDEIIASQNARIEELSEWGKQLDAELAKKDGIVISQNARIEELSAWGTSQEEEIKKKDEIIELQNARMEQLSLRVDVLEKENSEIKHMIESIKTASQEALATQHERVQTLQGKEDELNKIYNSRGWRYLQKIYKLEDAIIPLHSKRREALKAPYFMLKNLKLIIKHVNKENVKKFFSYIKKESPGQVLKHIKSYISRFKPIEKMELKIYETNDPYEKLSFTYSSNPLVSIIIPVYNQWNYTYSCLRSIMENTAGIEYEIIIADDVSNDETVYVDKFTENVVVARNTKNLGFLLNCNNAAKRARGKYILFLNNDTNVQKNWLRYLIDLIERDNKIGMVGSKLVFPDGWLQEAGGIIWKDASGWNYGRLEDPEKPEYNYVKEVDYISGASIIIRTDLWKKIGGFDARYAPAYFEDSDLAFEVRKHGFKVMFQPKSVVVHFEGISHGTDSDTGIKSYQIKNKEKFIKKWEGILEKDQFENGKDVFLARDRSRGKKTILVIDHYVPHYDKDAGSRTTFQYLKLFIEMGLNVKFLGDNFYRHEPYTSDLQQLGIEVLYGVWYRDNWGKWVKENADEIDYVYLNRPHISIKYIDFIKHNTKAKIIYYGHDLHYLREFREYEISNDEDILKSAENWKKTEYELFSKADVIYYPSQTEVDEIKRTLSGINAKAIPAYIFDNTKPRNIYEPETRKDIMFVGGFTHKPNIDAVSWFVKEIYPLVLNEIPEMKLYIIGSNPTDEIMALASDSIIVTGFVTDEQLDKYYENCKLTVVPLRYGAGVKGKIVEAMHKQLPVITTPTGAEGLFGVDSCIQICKIDKSFAKKLINLYNDECNLKRLSNNALAYVNKTFSANRVLEIIQEDILA